MEKVKVLGPRWVDMEVENGRKMVGYCSTPVSRLTMWMAFNLGNALLTEVAGMV